MKLKKLTLGSLLVLTCGLLLVQCHNSTNTTTKEDSTATTTGPVPGGGQLITPVDLKIVTPGFHFPEDSNVIYGWLRQYNTEAINVDEHAWGIWAGLTAQSGEVLKGDSLRVYETWLSIEDVQREIIDSVNGEKLFRGKTQRSSLRVPAQFIHAGIVNGSRLAARSGGAFHPHLTDMMRAKSAQVTTDTVPNFWVSVSYSPAAATHASSNELLDSAVLASYGKAGGIGHIPAFPNNAITVKPTYFVGHTADTLIRVPVWPPLGGISQTDSFLFTAFNQYVYVDVLNRQAPGKQVTPVTGNSKPTPASTCNLNDFVYFRIDAAMAKEVNGQQDTGVKPVAAGDYALLVAMHVTSKEISNWTWQSFFWAPNPDAPGAPSSTPIAALRKKLGITGPAAHYALTTAYAMVMPLQPITGGTNTGVTPIIGYNPYLEAGFGPATFGSEVNPLNPKFKYGVQTNCMTCHSQATSDGSLNYMTDQYVDMNGNSFLNKVQLDFAWSIQSNIIPDSALHRKGQKK